MKTARADGREAMENNAPLGAIGRALAHFFAREARDLPWRRTQDPYAIWVSEIMLQQTQVDTVVPRFHAFLRQFPSVEVLAAATAHQVCEAWSGMGYYRRARFLHAAAQRVVLHHQGRLPSDVETLMTLPGIGRYTAGAIASLAFGKRVPLVDGNVARVLSRLFLLPAHLGDAQGTRLLWEAAQALVDAPGRSRPSPGVLNEAMIELGATVCLPRAPACSRCPVKRHCRAKALDMVAAYPPVAPRAQPKALHVVFVVCRTAEGVWLSQRGLEGLWAGQWEPPSSSGAGGLEALRKRRLIPQSHLGTVTHLLTHRRVTADIWRGTATARVLQKQGLVPFETPLKAPLSALARRALLAVETRLDAS